MSKTLQCQKKILQLREFSSYRPHPYCCCCCCMLILIVDVVLLILLLYVELLIVCNALLIFWIFQGQYIFLSAFKSIAWWIVTLFFLLPHLQKQIPLCFMTLDDFDEGQAMAYRMSQNLLVSSVLLSCFEVAIRHWCAIICFILLLRSQFVCLLLVGLFGRLVCLVC